MAGLGVGLMDPVMAARPTVDAFSRASYLGAVASLLDSYWVPDHINVQTPRPLWDKKYTASARLLKSPDAPMEAWTLLGAWPRADVSTAYALASGSPTPASGTPP